ncbi:MAG: Carbon monoxide dehydrogenase medium chain [Chroococcidiopsis sp. SAG 2025]|uniref:FAD binding domain-containing protein n=1 Tax=Chroococcidiopsis sp. SAG 2025 TaxID=171389 RepID=UPI0029371780|nr:FAD binding domain-containing protein [Chroococcidiopsis sp. SAG 2025]MDV2993779.1 Carbon monoxide dehydrogenase medium chain [Chroococcidiopsis sp. SAG 2025]
MIPVQFDYAAPATLEAAANLLKENNGAQILAGGHSLLREMKLGRVSPLLLVDLGKIQGLQGIGLNRDPNGVVQIGVMTTYAQTANAFKVKEKYRALAEAASSIGDAQIRNWGRIGDIFAYHDLACDLPAAALVLEATFNTIAPSSHRAILAEEFINASFNIGLEPGEIVTSIDLPPYVTGTNSAYEKFQHPASGYTICGIASLIRRSSSGIVSKCRVAVTGAHTHAIRLRQVEAALEGKAPTTKNIAAAANLATESVSISQEASKVLNSLSNNYISAEYRTHLMGVLTARSLTRATERVEVRSYI